MAGRNIFEIMQNALVDGELDIHENTENEDSDSDANYIPSSDDSDASDGVLSGDDESVDTSDEDAVPVIVRGAVNEANEFVGRDGTRWSKNPLPVARTPARNIVRHENPKVVNVGGHLEKPSDAFNLFFSDDMVDIIVKYTNLYARTKKPDWVQTDRTEIRALIGILIISGFTQNNNSNTEMLWSTKYGIPIIRATMNRGRFQMLLTYMRFDDREDRMQNRRADKLAPIRDLFTKFNQKLQMFYSPGPYLTVDEQLIPFRGRCSFKQYLPMKPDKYGLKLFWIVDAKTFYPLKCYPYLGKEGGQVQTGLGEKVVMELTRPYTRSGRNVTMDNYFTSLNLATNLEKDGLTLIGTVRQNRRFVPDEFRKNSKRPVQSSVFGFREKSTLVSYVPKKSKSVILLSSVHRDDDVVAEVLNKPEIILAYNETKGGVDSLDQLVHRYMTKRRTKRWPMVYMMNMIDVAGVAAYIIWGIRNPEWYSKRLCKRRLFLEALGEELVTSTVTKRMTTNTTARLLVDFQNAGFEKPPVAAMPAPIGPPKKKRCFSCPRKRDRKVAILCKKCNHNVCGEHSVIYCKTCVVDKA